MSRSCRNALGLAGICVLLLSPSALAIVETISASVTAEVKEYIVTSTGTIVNTDSAFEEFDESTGQTTPDLPLVIEVSLLPAPGEEQPFGAAGTSVFNDPRLATTSNPEEFGLTIGATSFVQNISHTGTSAATEGREVNFLPSEIGEREGTPLTARSWFFADAILLVWADAESTDLSETIAELTLGVEQERPLAVQDEDAEPTVLLSTGIHVAGQADGTVDVTTDGVLEPGNLVTLDLAGQQAAVGAAWMVILPDVAIPYTYDADVGELFTLQANIEAAVADRPGTGAAVVVGLDQADLFELIESLLGSSGESVGSMVAEARDKAPAPAKPLVAEGGTEITVRRRLLPGLGSFGVCGAMGAESLLVLATALLALPLWTRRP